MKRIRIESELLNNKLKKKQKPLFFSRRDLCFWPKQEKLVTNKFDVQYIVDNWSKEDLLKYVPKYDKSYGYIIRVINVFSKIRLTSPQRRTVQRIIKESAKNFFTLSKKQQKLIETHAQEKLYIKKLSELLELKKIKRYSCDTSKSTLFAKISYTIVRNRFKKPVSEKSVDKWMDGQKSVTNKNNMTKHSPTKLCMTINPSIIKNDRRIPLEKKYRTKKVKTEIQKLRCS